MVYSSRTRYLKGRVLEGASSALPVTRVEKQGDKRVVHFSDGQTQKYTHKQMADRFNATLQKENKTKALATVRDLPTGQTTVMLGGQVKTYENKGSAVRAVNNAYSKAHTYEKRSKG